jgi:hypothetical protein
MTRALTYSMNLENLLHACNEIMALNIYKADLPHAPPVPLLQLMSNSLHHWQIKMSLLRVCRSSFCEPYFS